MPRLQAFLLFKLATLFMYPTSNTKGLMGVDGFSCQPVVAHNSMRKKNHHDLQRQQPFGRSIVSSTTTRLYEKMNDEKDMASITGLQNGFVLLGIVIVLNVWLFTIPTEFRRAQWCTEEQVRLYPESNCMTPDMWIGGVSDYYQQGGGVNFDFSIEGKE